MQNKHILSKLEGIQEQLISQHKGANPSSASKGREREEFINNYLQKIMPNVFRFGSGEITDVNNQVSGHVDIVIEYPFFPSLSTTTASTPRLYMAEGVAAVIEVKSDLEKQWGEVLDTSGNIKKLERKWEGNIFIGNEAFANTIPVFAVGYKGWKTKKTIEKKLSESNVDAILVIESGMFVSNSLFDMQGDFTGAKSLWAFITCLHLALDGVKLLQSRLENYMID